MRIFDKDYEKFVKKVCSNYITIRNDVDKMIQIECDDLSNYNTKNKRSKESCLEEAIKNCESWLRLERTEIYSEDLARYRLPYLFFTSLKTKEIQK